MFKVNKKKDTRTTPGEIWYQDFTFERNFPEQLNLVYLADKVGVKKPFLSLLCKYEDVITKFFDVTNFLLWMN